MKNIKIIIAISLTPIFLAGCVNKGMQAEVDHAYNSTFSTISKTMHPTKKSNTFVVKKGRYSDSKLYSIQPSWKSRKISIHAYQQPLSSIMNILLAGSKVNVIYNDDTNSSLVNINYVGTVAGAVNQILLKNNLYYSVQHSVSDSITWSETQSKVYNIAYLPGSTQFELGNANAGTKNTVGSTSLKGDISVWNDISNAIKLLLSSKGKLVISQSAGTITVIDKPLNIARITKVVKKYNDNLSKRVTIRVKILEVQLNKQHQYGIDWSLVYKGAKYAALSGNTLSSITTMALNGGSDSGKSTSTWAGTTALINALDQQGKTAIIDEPTITSLNNSPSSIGVTDKRAYIKSTETTTTGYGDAATVNYTVNPDNIVTGLKMTLIPHIQDGKIYLSINGSLSSLQKLTSVSYGNSSTSNAVQVQLPETTSKDFNQRVMVPNGHVIVLSGLRMSNNSHIESENFKLKALGSDSDLIDYKELVILIEPTIIE